MTTPIEDIPASSIPAARAWLYAGLQSLYPVASGVLVCLDEPSTDQPQDIIAVADVHQTYGPFQTVGSGGAGWLTEEYSVQVIVDCWRGGDNAALVFTQARTLADAVVALVRSDPSLGGAVDRARPGIVAHESAWLGDQQGRQTVITIPVDCLNAL